MKNIIIYIIGCLLILPFGLKAQTLNDYLKIASENNPSLKASFTEFEASLTRVSQVNALPDPTLSFGVFVSPIETRVGAQRARVSISQMFPWFGTLKAKESVATLQAEAKYQEFLNEKNELFFKVKKAYYPIYEVNKQIELMESYLAILITYKQLATTSVANGKGTLTDVIRVDIMIENMKTDIQLMRDKLTPLTTTFNRLLNRSDSLEVVVSDSLSSFHIEEQYRRDSLLTANPMIKAMETQIQATDAMIEVAQKKGLPQFGVGLDYMFISERTDMSVPDNGKNAIMPMVTMSVPIFRGKYKASVEEAELMKTSMEYKKESLENNLFSSYEATWYELDRAHQLIALYDTQMEKTEQVIRLLYTAYSNSGKDFEEVLRMQQQLLKYQMALVSENIKFFTALAQLDYITAKSE